MAKNTNKLFSNQGFYFGAIIFLLGFILMIARLALDLTSLNEQPIQKENLKDTTTEKRVSETLTSLQNQLDKKIKEETTLQNSVITQEKIKNLEILEHNPTKNRNGSIKAIEFIDFNCQKCLTDASFTNTILEYNEDIKLTTKLYNVDKNKNLNIANLAALVAAKNGKFFQFKEKILLTQKTDLNSVISYLAEIGIPLTTFRQEISNKPDLLLNNLTQDIYQGQSLNLNSYTIIINDKLFSDSIHSPNKLKDIGNYVDNL